MITHAFTFPWPHKSLSPNARVNRFERAKLVRAYRTGVAWEARAAGIRGGNSPALHVALTFCPPDNRRWDLDNMLASIKPGLDGIADVIGVDDSKWSLSLSRGPAVKRGVVHVIIQGEA